jgi:hypothetical protein
LPRHDRLIAQIVGLERRVSRAGRDSSVGVFVFEFWHDDRVWNGGAPSSDDLL